MEDNFQIFDYLDGTMTPQQEESFFNNLLQNEELRTEFRQQVALKSVFAKDLHSYVPSPETTLNLFSKLGMGVAPVAASPSFLSKLTSFINSSAVKSAGLTLLLSGITFFTLLKINVIEWYDADSPKTELIGNGIKPDINAISTEKNTHNFNSSSNNFKDTPITKTQIIEKVITKNSYIFTLDTFKLQGDEKQKAIAFLNNLQNDKELKDNKLEKTDENISSVSLLSSSNLALYDLNFVNSNSPKIIQANLNNVNLPNLDLSSWNLDLPISVEISNSVVSQSLNNSSQIDINRDYSNLLNNKISLFYNLNSDFQIGADFRKESYFQEFNIIDKRSRLLTYYQQPEFNVLSGSFRYLPSFLELNTSFFDLKPFFMASYGLDLFGGGDVIRAGAGVNLYISKNMYFQASYDYSNLKYVQDALNYNSNKYNLNFGIGWNFSKWKN